MSAFSEQKIPETRKQFQDERLPIGTRSNNFENYEVDRLLGRIKEGIRCPADPAHGSYEYICTNSDSICDKLVCVDCLRTDPLHFNAHSRQFVRIREFLESITTVVQKNRKDKQLDQIRYLEKRTRGLIDSFDKQTERVLSSVNSFFANLQERYTNVLQKKVAAASKRVSEEFLADIVGDRQHLGRILEACSNFTKFNNKSHILELFLLLEKGGNNSNVELRKRFAKLNKLMTNFDRNVDDWLARCGPLEILDDKDFLPQVNLNVLNPHLNRHEQVYSNVLEGLLPDTYDSLFTISSRKVVSTVLADVQMQNHDHSMSQTKQNSRLAGLGEEHGSMILEPPSAFNQKNKRLQEIDRRIQEIFHEAPEVLDERSRHDRVKLDDLSRSFREPEESRLENMIGIQDLMGDNTRARGTTPAGGAEIQNKCKLHPV